MTDYAKLGFTCLNTSKLWGAIQFIEPLTMTSGNSVSVWLARTSSVMGCGDQPDFSIDSRRLLAFLKQEFEFSKSVISEQIANSKTPSGENQSQISDGGTES